MHYDPAFCDEGAWYNASKRALRLDSEVQRLVESTPRVRTNLECLIRRLIAPAESLDAQTPADLKGRIWLYRICAARLSVEFRR
jgi:hypothetical protein